MTHAKAVAWFLDRARDGDGDDAFHGLRELPDGALPALEAAYRAECDPDLRSLIIAAVREHPSDVRLDFLAEALDDPSPVVWKRALDALVALASDWPPRSWNGRYGRRATGRVATGWRRRTARSSIRSIIDDRS